METVVSEMKRQLENGDLKLEQKISLLNDGINEVLSTAGVSRHSCVLTDAKTRLYVSGVLDHCVHILSLDPRSLRGSWSSVSTLAQLTSSCCVGVEPGQRSETFNRFFLPSLMDGLLSLASHLMRRAECVSLFRKVMMDSVGRLFRVHPQLAAQVLSSVHYEQIQMCDDAAVCLLCIQLWIQACTSSSNFSSRLTDDSLLLLLNEAVAQLVVSSGSAVGGASIRLMLLMASQQELRVHRCLLSFRGLDSLLEKDWRGQGFDQEVDQLVKFIQSDKSTRCSSQEFPEHVKAACVIQAAWRSYQTRRRVRSLNRAVSTLQKKYRARMKQKQQQKEAEHWEEELRFQVVLRRQQARRQFHERQRDLLQLLPADQLQTFLHECERRAAVVIQRTWRGFKERRRYTSHRNTLRQKQQKQQAAVTLQRAVRLFLQKRRALEATSCCGFWIGQKGLTDSRKTELKKQVERYISLRPSSHVSREECERLHEDMQLLLMLELQKGNHQRREEERIKALLARTHTQMELLIDAPHLSAATESDVESFLSPSGSVAARARNAHNEMLQWNRRPWWKRLGDIANAGTNPTLLIIDQGCQPLEAWQMLHKLIDSCQTVRIVVGPTQDSSSSSISLPHAGTLPRFPTVPAPLSSLPTGINPPSSPRGITMPNLFNLPSMTIPSLPRGLSLPRPVAMAAVYEATRRLLQDCCSVLDHQAPGGLCGCCWALRPRYKRLVDNIFPEDPEEGLVKANMEKLTFFALSAPEKLDRIAAYLSERLTRELNRHRYGYVCIAMEAMEQLLLACHCQSINLLVESFLSTLRLLLEADKPHLHILATSSFVKFANIEEDTPSYHRSYDFFVSRFSEMCHSEHEDLCMQNKIRVSGIRGLQGVVRKTVDDELQVNIWEPRHMEKIVPALLVNLQQHIDTNSDSPAEQTEVCFRELLGRAAYGHINNAIRPVLMHLDTHSLWEGRSFAVQCFHIIMFSIQSQHSHLVIQQLLGHLDANSRSPASVRAGIVEVLSEAAVIEASGSVGPTVLEVFNTLLRQLRQSVDYQLTGYYDNAAKHRTTSDEEKTLQDAVIKTIGSFANMLPVYQRSEVMLFIMGKIPVPGIYPALGSPNAGFEGSRMIQVMLLKSLLQVSEHYESTNLLTALPSSFLEPLLSFTLMEEPEIRLLVLSILTSLIDRHQNAARLANVSVMSEVSALELKDDTCCRQDNLFIRKHAQRLYRHVYLACKEESSGRGHYQALVTLLAVLGVELAGDEVLVDLIRLVLALQELALSNQEGLSTFNRCGLHAVCATCLHLLSQLGPPPELQQHVTQVIEIRQKNAPHLLPDRVFTDEHRLPEGELKTDEAFLFSQSKICEALTGSSFSVHVERLNTPYTPQLTDEDRLSKRKSIGDVISLQTDMDPNQCPDAQQHPQTEQITFETLKSTIEDRGSLEEEERRRRMQLVERFQTAPFEEIAAHCGARTSLLQSEVDRVFDLMVRPPPSPAGQPSHRSTPLYEMKFPDLCVY